MTKQEAIKQGIARIKGQEVKLGTIVGTEDNPRAWQFDGYDGEQAMLSIGDEKRLVSRTEIFDANKLKNVANHLLNLGFWEEGMESISVRL